MPVLSTATHAEFQRASYMIEAVYRSIPMSNDVWFAMTTPASNAGGGYPDLWDVFLLPAAGHLFDVLPFRYLPEDIPIVRLGSFGEVDAEIRDRGRYPNMQSYCQAHNGHRWYRHWVGFSQRYHTLDGQYHCLDVYWQPPQMVYGPVWIWYVMMDQNEPTEYWRGRIMYFNGCRDMGVELAMADGVVRPSML